MASDPAGADSSAGDDADGCVGAAGVDVCVDAGTDVCASVGTDSCVGAGGADVCVDAFLFFINFQLQPNQLKLSLLYLLQVPFTRPVSCQPGPEHSPAAWPSWAVDHAFRKGSNAPHVPASLNSCH